MRSTHDKTLQTTPGRGHRLLTAALGLTLLIAHFAPASKTVAAAQSLGQRVVQVEGDALQAAIDAAAPGGLVLADPNRQIIVEETIRVDKPLTISGLHAKLIDGLDETPLMKVTADGFRMDNFHLIGNRHTVEHQNRASLVVIEASDFIVEKGTIEQSSEHGIEISANGRHAENGTVRDIIGHDMGRDHISLQGTGEHGFFVKNVVVERIRAYGSNTRGALEVADGNENITVRDIYAEDCRYGVDFQDHVKQGMGQTNLRVTIEKVFTRRCSHAVRSATAAGMGHRNLTLRDISGTEWIDGSGEGKMAQPIVINHTDNVLIENVDLMGEGETIYSGLLILNSNNVRIKNLVIDEVSVYREAVLVENCSGVLIQDAFINATARVPGEDVAMRYRLNSEGVYRDLRVHDLRTAGTAERIVLEAAEPIGDYREYHKRRFTGERMQFGEASEEVALLNYEIQYDPALVDDRLGVERAHVRAVAAAD